MGKPHTVGCHDIGADVSGCGSSLSELARETELLVIPGSNSNIHFLVASFIQINLSTS